jgi:hypothetical protein
MELQVQHLPFPSRALERWRDGDHDGVLNQLHAGSFVRWILVEKLANRKRPGRRFFGEAFVVAKLRPESAWYGSFKSLTSWPVGVASSFGDEYRAALSRAFPEAPSLSSRAKALRRHLGGKVPVPRDLWVVHGGHHKFIEVKLPGDTVRPSQIAGLAAIATWLAPTESCSVWVYELYPDGQPEPRRSNQNKMLFEQFVGLCERSGEGLRPKARG